MTRDEHSLVHRMIDALPEPIPRLLPLPPRADKAWQMAVKDWPSIGQDGFRVFGAAI